MEYKYIKTFSKNYEKVNDEFVKCTISVMSCDQVANGTKFVRSGVEEASPTLNYAPVIGYFNGDDFEGHGQEIVWTDNGVDFIVKTIPFGVCIKDTQRWEKVQKTNGEYEDYFCVDAYIWSRYKEATEKVMENKCNQSMEVNVSSGEYKESYYEINKFSFGAVCILGEDVTPAFNLAKIRTCDKFEKEDFKVEYSEMIQALDKYLAYEKGGEKVEDEIKEIEVLENTESQEIQQETMTESEVVEIATNEEVSEDKKEEEYSEDVVEEKIDYESLYNELNVKYSEIELTINKLKEDYTILETEAIDLREYKSSKEKTYRLEKEEELFGKFEEIKDNEEFNKLKKECSEYSLEDLEDKLFAILGKAKFTEKKQNKKQEKQTTIFNRIENSYEEENPKSKYEVLINKYKNK